MIKNLFKQYAVLLSSVLALALLAGACYLTYVVTDNHWSAKYSGLKQEYSDASAKAIQEARIKEWEYQNNVDAIAQQGAKREADANAAAVGATASIEQLHQRLNTLLANTSTETPGTGLRGRTPNETIVLLTNVFQKSVERNRQLAAFADKSWNAAKQCYDSYYATQ
jgi:hypothetical protein